MTNKNTWHCSTSSQKSLQYLSLESCLPNLYIFYGICIETNIVLMNIC